MMVVGLTGGIGSGKSTVAHFFRELGIPVYMADDEAKRLMTKSKRIRKKIKDAFGDKAYTDGKLNRPYLAAIVFQDTKKLKILNAIVHPEVGKHFKKWVAKQSASYVMQENALLFENGSFAQFDKIILITAPFTLKMQRLLKRDHATREQIQHRMDHQWDDEKKIDKADFVLKNIDLKETKKHVLDIHNQLLKLLQGL